MFIMEDDFGSGCLRVAASSNKRINPDGLKAANYLQRYV